MCAANRAVLKLGDSSGPDHLVGPVVKASASRAGDPGFESRLRRGFFFRVESHQWFNIWHSCGYLARRLAF